MWYVPFFLAKLTVVAILTDAGISLSFSTINYVTIMVLFSYLVLLLCRRPYSHILDILRIVLC